MSPTTSLQKCWRASILAIAIFLGACTSQEAGVTTPADSFPSTTEVLPTSTPIPTQTLKPTLMVPATPTTYIDTAATPNSAIPPICLSTGRHLASKDEVWMGVDCNLYRQLIIVNKTTGKEITIPYPELDSDANNYFSIRPLSWSSDNQYFYFTSSCCEPYETANRNGSLYRFDTEKESWDVFIRAVYDPYYFFSENGDRLVYINHYPFENTISVVQYVEVGMLELSSNKSKRIVLTGYYAPTQPSYAWSKSNDEFRLTLDHPILSEMRTEEVLLKIDFEKMDMWFVE